MKFITNSFDSELRMALERTDNMANTLFLAYGYINIDDELGETLGEWFHKNKKRKIIIIIGLHGKVHINREYESVRAKIRRPVKEESINYDTVANSCTSFFRKIRVSLEDQDRILILPVLHFHAKIFCLAESNDDLIEEIIDFEDINEDELSKINLKEVILGSSNLTEAAFNVNYELDICISHEDNELLDKFSSVFTKILKNAATKYSHSLYSTKLLQLIEPSLIDLAKKVSKELEELDPDSEYNQKIYLEEEREQEGWKD
ncbi:phosphatidylserine/phosphatidylglycerophosphate/cardiolipin synthase-like enzyme [Pantoea agglomerans]|uniref:phospholipase D-like domain-containing protein n=1 Tax=Enterobacter agglomerans TaxID=549 RepID=UPI0015F8C19C|nr:phospholipase D-like domain-containing protein [Pantoea agglomerans]MBA8867209.1 phosphatidylserine/phosphatidylglycerophosphate/cardiolipin synthase-like enzyme [Pantoea agglomerans]MBA8894236.1 phosphatidylserine/phosphatidylglycerophosphate/cardiolipin synthase-like enzyme [Pantoea agglomerans]